LLSDAALAVAVFALSLGLLAASGTDLRDGHGGVDAPGVLLTALASLPLVARRAAPLGVLVVMGVASAVLRGIAEPAGPPLGPPSRCISEAPWIIVGDSGGLPGAGSWG
jgi:hypothetical protein